MSDLMILVIELDRVINRLESIIDPSEKQIAEYYSARQLRRAYIREIERMVQT